MTAVLVSVNGEPRLRANHFIQSVKEDWSGQIQVGLWRYIGQTVDLELWFPDGHRAKGKALVEAASCNGYSFTESTSLKGVGPLVPVK